MSASLGADVVDGVSLECQAQKEALATVKSPVAVVESKSPSVQREDVENAVFPSPPVVPDDYPLLHDLNVIFLVSNISIWRVLIAGLVAVMSDQLIVQ